MVSDQFRKDYRQMTAQGVKFTPEDIIRLNALSVKTQRSTTAARDVCLPRLAFLPADSWWRAPVVLREPTIAHDLWLEMAERWIDTSKDSNFLFLHAFALSRHPGRLPDATRPKKVVRAVSAFAVKRLAKFTREQLRAAVEYALFGADWTVGENGKCKMENGKCESGATSDILHSPFSTINSYPSPTIGLLTDARMLRLPITLDDAKKMTSSELTEAINRCWDEIEKKFDPMRAHSKAFGEYVRAREEIKNRGSAASTPSGESR